MAKRVFAVVIVIVLAGGGVFLSTRTIAPPSHVVEKVIPNGQFLK